MTTSDGSELRLTGPKDRGSAAAAFLDDLGAEPALFSIHLMRRRPPAFVTR
ncbi:MAG: hypothetical protein PVH65_13925 [Chloroflexota bacterium]|jgi:hypothetical protein